MPAALQTLAFLLLPLLPVSAATEVVTAGFHPSKPDAETLHLWHLDEVQPPFRNEIKNAPPLAGLLNGARGGRPSLPGLGRSVSFDADAGGTPGNSSFKGAILLLKPAVVSGPADNAPADFRYFGRTGAFTYEMVVKFNLLPAAAKPFALELMSMDGDAADRIFNFRIEKEGFLAFIPLPHCGASGGGIATIPTSGPHAVDTQSWFHVAVTYDGNGGVTNNLKLYWTRLGNRALAANQIGSGTLSGDLNGATGDFAIGNEARSFSGNAEAEPFPGRIDEVRISGVARDPSDFFFIPEGLRVSPAQAAAAAGDSSLPPNWSFKLNLHSAFVDLKPANLPAAGGDLVLKSGLHRLDFDFGFSFETADGGRRAPQSGPHPGNVQLRCQLEGIDERWQETDLGMSLICQALDKDNRVVSQSRFQSIGRSPGWETTPEDSVMTRRVEPVYFPAGTHSIKLILTSGPPDTTGFLVIDYFGLHPPGKAAPSLWQDGVFIYDARTTSPAGAPEGWRRAGDDPAIARMILRSDHPGIGLVDGDQAKSGEWVSVQKLPPSARLSGTHVLSWYEAYNVIGGGTHRATYVNVPPGKYTFRAIGLAGNGEVIGDELSLPIVIPPPFWLQFWFLPALTAGGVALGAAAIFAKHRQRSKRSLEKLRFQNALERDRSRIARDMHDDLGSRVTFINMSAALAQRDIEHAPENARRHLARMTDSARDLIIAMDDLVWAVDPTHDTLDHLGSHLARMAEEMFRDSPIRCRLDIPALLPALPLGAEFRNHLALTVKESLHNILRHAGPCEVFLALTFNGDQIEITIRDTGIGFDPASDERGHGLDNLGSRFKEIGGTCQITSSPGAGTSIVLRCPVNKALKPKP